MAQQAIVDVMGTPVSQLATGVFVPVTERVVAIAVERNAAAVTFPDLWQCPVSDFRCRTEPQVPVEFCRNGRDPEVLGEEPNPPMPQVTFLTVPIRPARTRAMACRKRCPDSATLHRADLEDTAGLLNDFLDQLAFCDGQCERLFAVDVFACEHRFDSDLRVPMIRRLRS